MDMSAYSAADLISVSFDLPVPDTTFFWDLLTLFEEEALETVEEPAIEAAFPLAGSFGAVTGCDRWGLSTGSISTDAGRGGRVGRPEAVTPRGAISCRGMTSSCE